MRRPRGPLIVQAFDAPEYALRGRTVGRHANPVARSCHCSAPSGYLLDALAPRSPWPSTEKRGARRVAAGVVTARQTAPFRKVAERSTLRSETRPPPCRSSRPAISSSSSTVRTIAGATREPHEIVDADRRGTEQRDDPGALVACPARPGRRLAVRLLAPADRALWPRIGRSTASTSAASVTSVAPCLSRPLVPSARGSSGEPGTANTSRPCSSAMRAVISEPERRAASTTTTPSDKAGDQPVAAREIARARLPAERHFGDRGALRQDLRRAAATCSRRIDVIVAAGQHRDRAGREARAMGGGVDAARQSRDDARSQLRRVRARAARRISSPAAEALREPTIATIGLRQRRELAAHREQRRRIVDHAQPLRIVGFAERDQRDAEPRAAAISRSASARGQMRAGSRRAAAAGEFGQRVERRPRAAVVIDQRAEGARPDIVAADEPQPVEPLRVGQTHARIGPVGHAVPQLPGTSMAARYRLTTGRREWMEFADAKRPRIR